ncbi:MAG TPA: glycosyltransferase [Ornithinibacter sp.]|nr:glycosyltransferase [Ornithinibacter sp.]
MKLDKRSLGRAMSGPGGAPLRLAYRAAVVVQLAAVTAGARVAHRGPDAVDRAETARRVTVAVKTFERPEVARRLVRGLRRVFDGRIVIADDSREPMTHPDPEVDVIALPFNSGVSAGRQAALDVVTTEYVLVTDDDIVFTEASDIDRARRTLDENPEIDVVGFLRVDLPGWSAHDHGDDALFPGHDTPLREWGTLVGGLPVRHKIAQVYLARTEAIRAVGWDENIRMVDHRDFFSRAAGHLLVVQDASNHVYHARTPFNAGYTRYREQTDQDLAYLARVWGERAKHKRAAERASRTTPPGQV